MHAAVPLADVSLSCYTLVDITRARQGFLMSTPHAVMPYQPTTLPSTSTDHDSQFGSRVGVGRRGVADGDHRGAGRGWLPIISWLSEGKSAQVCGVAGLR